MRALLLGTFIAVFSPFAVAGLLIEPYGGYTAGDVEVTSPLASAKYETKGLAYGGRLGFKGDVFWLAMDYGYHTPESELHPVKFDVIHTQLGASLGIDLVAGLRLFGGYIFDNQMKFKNETSSFAFSGTAIKAGAGIKLPGMPLALNVEYIMHDFDKRKSGTIEQSLEEAGITELKYNPIFVSLSLPFELM